MWCDTAHQELVKVIVLQSAVYSCEKIPDTLVRRLTPVCQIHSRFSCAYVDHLCRFKRIQYFSLQILKIFLLLLILRSWYEHPNRDFY